MSKIGEYKIVRGHSIDRFEEEVQEALADGWQPLNRHGFESNDDFDYVMELVRVMDDDEYREMVYNLREDQWDAEANAAYEASRAERDADTIMADEPDNDDAMREIVRRIQAIGQESASPLPRSVDPIFDVDHAPFDDELFEP